MATWRDIQYRNRTFSRPNSLQLLFHFHYQIHFYYPAITLILLSYTNPILFFPYSHQLPPEFTTHPHMNDKWPWLINLSIQMSLGCGWKSEHPAEIHKITERMHKPHTAVKVRSDQGTWCCETVTLLAVPPCHPLFISNIHILHINPTNVQGSFFSILNLVKSDRNVEFFCFCFGTW